jgi:hypothetical protein
MLITFHTLHLLNQTEMLSTAESKEYWAQETYMQGHSPLYCTSDKPTFLALHFCLRNTPTEHTLPRKSVSKLLNILETKNFIF